MDVKLTTNATLSLLNQVGRAKTDAEVTQASPQDDSATISTNPDNHVIMIRDSLTDNSSVYGFVQMSDTELSELGGYLTSIRDKELALLVSVEGSLQQKNLVQEKQSLEQAMSAYVGDKIHSLDDFQMQVDLNSTSTNSFMDVVDIYDQAIHGDQTNLVGLLSVVEVDITTVFENSHNPSSCPHCMSSSAGNPANQPHDVGFASTDYTYTNAPTSSDSGVASLRMGPKWNVSGGGSLTYSFANGTTPYAIPYAGNADPDTAMVFGYDGTKTGMAKFTGISAIESLGAGNEAALRTVMDRWDKTVAFDLTEITEDGTNAGEIRMAWTDGGTNSGNPSDAGRGQPGGRAAFAYGPYGTPASGDAFFETYDINKIADATLPDFASDGIGNDGFSYFAALHEIGHSLGLKHTFSGANSITGEHDILRNSVMSYTQIDRNTIYDFDGGTSDGTVYRVFASTPMIWDIKAMAEFYGAETVSDGDSTYTFTNDSQRLQPVMMQTISDSGGVDTIDASNQSRVSTIDLTPGTFSTIGLYTEQQQADYWAGLGYGGGDANAILSTFVAADNQAQSAANSGAGVAYANRKAIYTGEDNLAIAHNAQIENAIGGSAGDTITGNSLDNAIEGRGGNDTLSGGSGDDALTGGAGDDTIEGGSGVDTGILSGSSDQYTIDYTNYDKSTQTGTITVTDNQAARDGTDTFENVEYLKFSAGEASARGAQVRTDTVTASDMTGTHQMAVQIDGGTEITVTFTGRDYATLGLSYMASDMEAAINAALAADGQASTVTVTVNSPLTITSNDTSSNSAVEIKSLSLDLRAALGNITQEGAISVGDTVYYNLGGGYVTTYAPLVVPTIQSTSGTPNLGGGGGISPQPGANPGGSNPGGGGGTGSGGGTQAIGNGLGGTGLPNLNSISVLTQEDTVIAIQTIDRAINQISQNQARLGAIQNRMEHNIDNLMSQVMQTETARGRIVDADFAAETAKLMKDQILQQAAMQAMNMALNSKQGVMSLVS